MSDIPHERSCPFCGGDGQRAECLTCIRIEEPTTGLRYTVLAQMVDGVPCIFADDFAEAREQAKRAPPLYSKTP